MYKFLTWMSVLLIAFGLWGCGPAAKNSEMPILPTSKAYPNPPSYPNPTGNTLPPLTGNWRIHIAQTGGFAGVSRTLEISAKGVATLTDERTKKQTTTQLTDEQMTKLTGLVASTQFLPVRTPKGCADCFNYDLQINNGSADFHAQTDDANLADTGLEPLIRFLGQLINGK